jgi:peptidyl-dipeptidase Dcp
LQNPSIVPFLQYSSVRPLREKIWKAYANRGNNSNEYDNGKIVVEIANLRMERAKLLGYDNHSSYILENNMAKNPKTVLDLLYKLWEPSIKVSKLEAYDLQSMIYKEGNNFKLEPWDWSYYSEKVRIAKFNLNEEEMRPYFKLENVRDGIFTLVNKLYGVSFKPRNDLPLYHHEVMSYEVFDADGSHLGILYMDFFPRDSKKGGAWMTNYREQYFIDANKITPVVSLVMNFSKPTGDQPSLLTLDEVQTFFHEFGHGMHGLLSNCKYLGISGTNVSRDFVELPSQIMEHWATEPELLKLYAKHYKTGEVIPQSLIDKMDKSSKFNQGFATVEYLAAAYLDIFYHSIESPINVDANKFENDKLNELGLIPEIISRYRSQYFRHAFSGGYDSGYYSYIWSGVLDSDAFEAFKQNGIFDKKTATAFRKNILERGNTDDPQKLYKLFRGADPSIEPLLKNRGLN